MHQDKRIVKQDDLFTIIKGKVSTSVSDETSHAGICNSKYKSTGPCFLELQGILYDWTSVSKGKANESWD